MKFDRTSIIATIVFLIFAVGYDYYIKNKYPHLNTPESSNGSPITPPPLASSPSPEPSPESSLSQGTNASSTERSNLPPSASASNDYWTTADLTFESNHAIWVVDPENGGFSQVELKDYRTTSDPDSPQINLVDESLWLQPLITGESLTPRAWAITSAKARPQITMTRTAGDIQIDQTLTFPTEGYEVDWRVTYRNLSARTITLHGIIGMEDALVPLQHQSSFLLPGFPMGRPSIVAGHEKGIKHYDSEKSCEKDESVLASSPGAFMSLIGLDSFYFLRAIRPLPLSTPPPHPDGLAEETPYSSRSRSDLGVRGYYSLQKRSLGAGRGCRFLTYLGQDLGSLKASAAITVPYKLYFGPKDYRITGEYSKVLTETIDLGWFSFLSFPLLYLLHIFYDWLGNYGLAIIALTLGIKILFYPLTKSAALSMQKNRLLQPQIAEIRKRHSSDPRKQQSELMAFMAQNGTNPFKGCLPILLQMPVFFALYRVLSTAVELRHAPLGGWIQDLSVADPYFITPILMTGCMMLQQKITGAPQMALDEMQQKIFKWLPLVFGLMMIGFPAGMVIYMLVNTVVSIAQQYYINHRFGLKEAAPS